MLWAKIEIIPHYNDITNVYVHKDLQFNFLGEGRGYVFTGSRIFLDAKLKSDIREILRP
jgi:hypothetical protein